MVNIPFPISGYGVSLMDVSVSAVTNTVAYDALGRQIANTDGRGNTTHTEYNAFGQRAASIDALGNRTTYAYDQFGNLASVTDPLGNAIVYEYDLRGRKTYEGGATYPVRYAYDYANAITKVITYHREESDAGHCIAFVYDEGCRALTCQVNPDGTKVLYSYNGGGKLVGKTLARGIAVEYSHDAWNDVKSISYSDSTPRVGFLYDAMGRLISVVDDSGLSTFAWDVYGQCTNETTSVSKVERFYDEFGRLFESVHSSGTVLTNVYDEVSARLASTSYDGIEFSYNYLPGTDLEAEVDCSGVRKIVHYESKKNLVREIVYTNLEFFASRVYGYDAIGNITRREQLRSGGSPRYDYFSNDARSQLTNAVVGTLTYSYNYDDTGNRMNSTESGANIVYRVNNLNQYTFISDDTKGSWTPAYDADGNQTVIKTETGEWFVEYNGENRPVTWSNGTTDIVCSYDWMGRRIGKKVFKDGAISSEIRFSYDGDLIEAEYAVVGTHTSLITRTFWDNLRSNNARPLAVKNSHNQLSFCLLDVTKNVCEMLSSNGELVQTYDYAPFGAVIATNCEFENSIVWASERFEKDIGLYSYLNRDYDFANGRWLSKDPLLRDGYNFYSYVNNMPVSKIDWLGLAITKSDCDSEVESVLGGALSKSEHGLRAARLNGELEADTNCHKPEIKCRCCNDYSKASYFSGSARDSTGSITICADNISSLSEVRYFIVHELAHAYDSCKGFDFRDCKQRACSEVRATILSGECQIGGCKRRYQFGPRKLRSRRPIYWEPEEKCVKRNAEESLKLTFKCIDKINEYIDKAYEECANNEKPID